MQVIVTLDNMHGMMDDVRREEGQFLIGFTSTPTAPEFHRQAQRSAGFGKILYKIYYITDSVTEPVFWRRNEATMYRKHVFPQTEQLTLQRTTLNGHAPLRSVPEVGADVLTHPNVPKAALSQLPLQQESFPGHFPSVPPKAHGEGSGVGTGLG